MVSYRITSYIAFFQYGSFKYGLNPILQNNVNLVSIGLHRPECVVKDNQSANLALTPMHIPPRQKQNKAHLLDFLKVLLRERCVDDCFTGCQISIFHLSFTR